MVEHTFLIRPVREDEYAPLGRMTAEVYEQLAGMPSASEQPDYYAMLRDVGGRAARPTSEILVAVSPDGELLGGVTFVGDMRFYGSGGTACSQIGCSGIRLLAVPPERRGRGVGKALTRACIQRARDLGSSQVILHTTKAMEIAWAMYEGLGFHRSPDLDFLQGALEVYGFRLGLGTATG